MDFLSEGLVMTGSGLAQDQRLVTIDKLPDDVLLEIFFYVNIRDWKIHNPWHDLVHVCRRWRYIVFASPRHLDLRFEYRGHRPISEALDSWPVLPVSLIILPIIGGDQESDWRCDNIIAALESEQSNRICEIYIQYFLNLFWKRIAAAMQKRFPELTLLRVWTPLELPRDVSALPESFLGGSAPRLRTLYLQRIPLPSIPKLLLSAQGLVTLFLDDIPDSGYFSPDAFATALVAMTRLKYLYLHFHSPRSRPDPESRPLPPPTRFVLPALTQLKFIGVYEYLEDLLARIDVPLLCYLYIEFFMDLNLDVPQLHRLIGHAEEFKSLDRARVSISRNSIGLWLYLNTRAIDRYRQFTLKFIWGELDNLVSSLCQVCSSSFPVISALEQLQIMEDDFFPSSHWIDNMETTQWLELLDSFTALKNLYLSDGIAQHFCGALQELSGERITKVLPALRNLFVPGSSLEPVREAVKSFVTARQLSGHPVVVDCWKDCGPLTRGSGVVLF